MRNAVYRSLKLSTAVLAAMLVYSCASIPEKAVMESSVQLLPSGTDVIIRADVEKNRELIEPVLAMFEGLPENLTEEFLARTETVWAGLDFNGAADGKTFGSSVVAFGDYPKGAIDWGLFWDSSWEKHSYNPLPAANANLPYWKSRKDGNQLVFPNKKYMMASAGEIEEMLDSWADGGSGNVDAAWLESESDADVTIMTRNLSPEDYAVFIPEFKKVPIESLILSMRRSEDIYTISGRFRMDSEVSSFLFSALFRTLVVTAKDPDGQRLFENPRTIKIQKDGPDVVLENMQLPVRNVTGIESEWLGSAGMK